MSKDILQKKTSNPEVLSSMKNSMDTMKNSMNSIKDLKKEDILIMFILFVVFIVVLVFIIKKVKRRFWKDTKIILLNDPKLEREYSTQSEERTRYIKLLTQERLDTTNSLSVFMNNEPVSPQEIKTQQELIKRLAYIDTQISLINVNEGLILNEIPLVPKDLMFSYSITFKIRNNSNCYNDYCFLYRGSDLTNSSPSFWINPVDSTLCIKVLDYTNTQPMELKTDTIPLQRWNTANIVFKNRDVYVHLNNTLFATFVLNSMPQYSNSSVKIHPHESYKFVHVSSVVYYEHALNIPIVSTPSLSIKF